MGVGDQGVVGYAYGEITKRGENETSGTASKKIRHLSRFSTFLAFLYQKQDKIENGRIWDNYIRDMICFLFHFEFKI